MTTVAQPNLIPPRPFLDVAALLEQSRPRQQANWVWYGSVGVLCALVFASFAPTDQRASAAGLVWTVLLVSVTASMVLSYTALRRFRRQQATVDAVEEMVQLRRWEPAGMLLDRQLSQPVLTPSMWVRLLVQLSDVLARHDRFEDALRVHQFLLDLNAIDPVSDYGVRVRRAMALLREDRLVDADRAIGDLRKRSPAGRSGDLALVELYRDVKTGHAVEAIALFEKRRDVIRDHLGHRLADGYALTAKAFDLLGRTDEATAAFARATVLAPAVELTRRYPELSTLAGRYPAAPAPREVA